MSIIKGTQQRSRDTRTAILVATRALMQTRAFDDITVAEIAAEAAIAKGSVMAHFAEKLAILAVFLAEGLETIAQSFEDDPTLVADSDALTAALTPMLVYLNTDKAMIKLLSWDGDQCPYIDILQPGITRFRTALAQGFARAGHAHPERDAELVDALTIHIVISGQAARNLDAAALTLNRLLGVLYEGQVKVLSP